jgi:hypothetical protein
MDWHGVTTLEKLHWRHTEGPFQFCHRVLGSRVRRCLSRIYDLTPQKLGVERFDLVFLGDILGHLFSPLQAMNVLAPLCDRLVMSYDLANWPKKWAVMVHDTGDGPRKDAQSWFQPNWECLDRLLRRLGFSDVRVYGRSRVLVRREWSYMNRHCILASRGDCG